MKPTRNRIYCRDCGRTKMLFETEKKALLFMKFNNEEIAEESDFTPTRAYFCEACGGWHVTHLTEAPAKASRTERMLDKLQDTKDIRAEQKQMNSQIKCETSNHIVSQLELVDQYVADEKYTQAIEILDALLELNKTKYIAPARLKRIRKKKEFVKSLM